ncbi:MAG: hypothetical protein BWY38_03038 [Ignavibacteria bacterium ADurb.Bin266]|nr:MAG: hypothetical protein BWY38_03038 [Ignavibacteria bacterium ADurb.Bin266]
MLPFKSILGIANSTIDADVSNSHFNVPSGFNAYIYLSSEPKYIVLLESINMPDCGGRFLPSLYSQINSPVES